MALLVQLIGFRNYRFLKSHDICSFYRCPPFWLITDVDCPAANRSTCPHNWPAGSIADTLWSFDTTGWRIGRLTRVGLSYTSAKIWPKKSKQCYMFHTARFYFVCLLVNFAFSIVSLKLLIRLLIASILSISIFIYMRTFHHFIVAIKSETVWTLIRVIN